MGQALSPAALDIADQNAPETLNRRFAYAEHLLGATDGDCRSRADAAQEQLDIVVAKPTFSIVMPLGAAQAASIAYDVHSTRASCGVDAALHEGELRAARDAALQAVDLYRDGFDYQSMAVMQVNAADAAHRLGDQAGAATLLRAAIAMDQAYGLQKDAQDDQARLRKWTGEPSGADGDAEPKTLAPARSVQLKFAWSARDADVAVVASYATVAEGKIIHSQGSATRTSTIRPDGTDWIMASPSNLRTFRFSEWPLGRAEGELATLLLANIGLSDPDIRISGAGDFKSLVEGKKASAKLSAETTKLIRSILPDSDGRVDAIPNLENTIKYDSTPDEIEAVAAENYGLTTATWIDARLDQGVWYNLTVPLHAPGTADVIDHDVHFAYTRPVPCTTASTNPSCVEIVLHATPNPVALGEWIAALKRELGLIPWQTVHYWSVTDIRIVTDPNSLLPYVSDVRRHWYVSTDRADKGAPVDGSERIVTTSTYH